LPAPLAFPARSACALLASALACAGAHAADDAARIRDVVDATIRPLMAREGIPGMAVALAVAGRSYVFDYGVAAQDTRSPVTENTLFEIGSVSKTFTATLAAYAVATGRLSLDDSPGKYLPQLKGRPIDQATLLHLGTYTAGGLPLQFPDGLADDAAALAWLRDWTPQAPPGTRRVYSNPSLGLFGLVTSLALKEDFATAIESRIFPAFGMAHSYVHVPERALADYAWGLRAGKPVRMNPGPLADETYGVRTTASDLIRFVQANIDPRGLEPPMRQAVEATHVGWFRAAPLVQGLGWEQYAYPVSREWLLGGNSDEAINDPQPAQRLEADRPGGPRLFDKTGSTGGFGAYVAFVPERRLGLVMLANRNYPIPARVEAAWTILEQLAPTTEPR
jgi:beta-lactamase class C